MLVFILILLSIMISTAKVAEQDKIIPDYLSREKTFSIKGIFVLLVFFSHGRSYISLGGALDDPYIALQGHLGQMIVAMFLFYSGYGMMEQIRKRGYSYIKSIVVRRVPTLLINFDLAVLLFLLLQLLMRKRLVLKTVLLSFVGWESLGNSNWYIFVVLVLYLLTYISFLPLKKTSNWLIPGTILLTVLSVVTAVLLRTAGKDSWWYNTIPLFVMGFWYSLFQKKIEALLSKSNFSYYSVLGLMVVAYIVLSHYRWGSLIFYYLWGGCFVALIVILSMKVSVESKILGALGRHVFSIYILQRIPFIILAKFPGYFGNCFSFYAAALAITIPFALFFEYTTALLQKRLFKA